MTEPDRYGRNHLNKTIDRDAVLAEQSVPVAAELAEKTVPTDIAYQRRMRAAYRELRKSRPQASAVETLKIHDELVEFARKFTGGDMSRLMLMKDGSIIIKNKR